MAARTSGARKAKCSRSPTNRVIEGNLMRRVLRVVFGSNAQEESKPLLDVAEPEGGFRAEDGDVPKPVELRD